LSPPGYFRTSHETITLQGLPLTIKAAHMKLSHSRMPFVRAYFRETQELVFDAHDKAFLFYGGVCLHAVGHAFQDGAVIDLTGWDPSKARNLFAGHTVYSIVLEKPDAELVVDAFGNKRVGVWAVATLATDAGGWRAINRVGLPMIHPLFTQFNEDLRNRLNAGRPADDFETYGEVVSKAIAGVVAANGTSEDPQGYGAKSHVVSSPTCFRMRPEPRRRSDL
jgi:Domain of unknown function (DUF4331)